MNILRLLLEGSCASGWSAGNSAAITGAPLSMVTRDRSDLVATGDTTSAEDRSLMCGQTCASLATCEV